MARRAPWLLTLLFLSVAPAPAASEEAEDAEAAAGVGKITVERTAEAVIVRSGTDQANFLFRAPAAFEERTPEKPFQVDLGHAVARVRLRVSLVEAVDAKKTPEAIAKERAAHYRGERKGEPKISTDGPRARVGIGDRLVLVVRDGTRLYELWLDGDAKVHAIADGFTILDPKGGPAATRATPEDLKQKELEHDYYRIKLLKPVGFVDQPVDPDTDQGIWKHLRAEDQERNLIHIHVRVHLARTLKKSVAELAQAAADRFANKYPDARVPKTPKRTRWPMAKEAYRQKMAGRLQKTGLVVQEEFVLLEHENGRVYEIQMTMFAGAPRAFKKQIKAFWKSVKIINK